MHYLLLCLTCLPAVALAQQALPENFSQEIFERRFRTVDKDGDSRLSRAEAYVEFPKAPRFFDEIDANRDSYVTVIEFNQAMERRGASFVNFSWATGTDAAQDDLTRQCRAACYIIAGQRLDFTPRKSSQ